MLCEMNENVNKLASVAVQGIGSRYYFLYIIEVKDRAQDILDLLFESGLSMFDPARSNVNNKGR